MYLNMIKLIDLHRGFCICWGQGQVACGSAGGGQGSATDGQPTLALPFEEYILLWEKGIQAPSPSQKGCFHLHQNQIIKGSPSQNHKTLLVLCYDRMKPPVNFTWFPHTEKKKKLSTGLAIGRRTYPQFRPKSEWRLCFLWVSSQSFFTAVSVL